jgi:hypothetical protein
MTKREVVEGLRESVEAMKRDLALMESGDLTLKFNLADATPRWIAEYQVRISNLMTLIAAQEGLDNA